MSPLKRGGPLRRSKHLKKKGPKSTLWDEFRAKKLRLDKRGRDELPCEDFRIGLPSCGGASSSPDLHHIVGREDAPSLYFASSNLVWLIRECHNAAHGRDSDSPSPEASDDAAGQVAQKTGDRKVLAVQSRPAQSSQRRTGTTVFSSVSHRYAPIVARKKEGVV